MGSSIKKERRRLRAAQTRLGFQVIFDEMPEAFTFERIESVLAQKQKEGLPASKLEALRYLLTHAQTKHLHKI